MGSKNRYAKHILPIMLTDRKESQYWVEPFVGGANIIDKVTGNRIGSDINENVINALINIRDNIKDLPKNNTEFTEEDYKNLQPDYIYYGYAGFSYSYSGKWKGGWCRDKEHKRDYVAESYKNALKQSPLLVNIDFSCASYDKLSIPPESIIYCDPPYKNTTKYTSSFDHDKFWQWCRDKEKEGHTVFVSEYEAPNDFYNVWEKKVTSSLTKNTGSKMAVEKLFRKIKENK
jgi:DNA adenine methylase|tara:strand:- start:47 stop:739 length:693 start_codon:yes stop_codon:yes gene_type:complete